MPTAYTIEFLASINRIISQERLSRYLAATNGDIGTALELYEHNIAISEALFGFLHGLEVAVRNSIHYTLRQDLGTPAWYDGGAVLPWSTTGASSPLGTGEGGSYRDSGASASRYAAWQPAPGHLL